MLACIDSARFAVSLTVLFVGLMNIDAKNIENMMALRRSAHSV